ncbi:CsgG/HfaB family protein [bacterium]
MNNLKKIIILFSLSSILFACAPYGVLKSGFDITSVNSIGVLSFHAYSAQYPASGEIIADEFSKQLLMKGYNIVERRRVNEILREHKFLQDAFSDPAEVKRIGRMLGVKYLLTGTVSKYLPEKQYLIIQGGNDLIALDGTGIRSFDLDESERKLVFTNAEVAISARLLEVETGSVVWIGTYSYESFDIETASAWTVSGLSRIFKKK